MHTYIGHPSYKIKTGENHLKECSWPRKGKMCTVRKDPGFRSPGDSVSVQICLPLISCLRMTPSPILWTTAPFIVESQRNWSEAERATGLSVNRSKGSSWPPLTQKFPCTTEPSKFKETEKANCLLNFFLRIDLLWWVQTSPKLVSHLTQPLKYWDYSPVPQRLVEMNNLQCDGGSPVLSSPCLLSTSRFCPFLSFSFRSLETRL